MKKSLDVTKYKKITPKLLTKLMNNMFANSENEEDIPEILLMTKKQRNDFDKYISKVSRKVIEAHEKHETSFGTLLIKTK